MSDGDVKYKPYQSREMQNVPLGRGRGRGRGQRRPYNTTNGTRQNFSTRGNYQNSNRGRAGKSGITNTYSEDVSGFTEFKGVRFTNVLDDEEEEECNIQNDDRRRRGRSRSTGRVDASGNDQTYHFQPVRDRSQSVGRLQQGRVRRDNVHPWIEYNGSGTISGSYDEPRFEGHYPNAEPYDTSDSQPGIRKVRRPPKGYNIQVDALNNSNIIMTAPYSIVDAEGKKKFYKITITGAPEPNGYKRLMLYNSNHAIKNFTDHVHLPSNSTYVDAPVRIYRGGSKLITQPDIYNVIDEAARDTPGKDVIQRLSLVLSKPSKKYAESMLYDWPHVESIAYLVHALLHDSVIFGLLALHSDDYKKMEEIGQRVVEIMEGKKIPIVPSITKIPFDGNVNDIVIKEEFLKQEPEINGRGEIVVRNEDQANTANDKMTKMDIMSLYNKRDLIGTADNVNDDIRLKLLVPIVNARTASGVLNTDLQSLTCYEACGFVMSTSGHLIANCTYVVTSMHKLGVLTAGHFDGSGLIAVFYSFEKERFELKLGTVDRDAKADYAFYPIANDSLRGITPLPMRSVNEGVGTLVSYSSPDYGGRVISSTLFSQNSASKTPTWKGRSGTALIQDGAVTAIAVATLKEELMSSVVWSYIKIAKDGSAVFTKQHVGDYRNTCGDGTVSVRLPTILFLFGVLLPICSSVICPALDLEPRRTWFLRLQKSFSDKCVDLDCFKHNNGTLTFFNFSSPFQCSSLEHCNKYSYLITSNSQFAFDCKDGKSTIPCSAWKSELPDDVVLKSVKRVRRQAVQVMPSFAIGPRTRLYVKYIGCFTINEGRLYNDGNLNLGLCAYTSFQKDLKFMFLGETTCGAGNGNTVPYSQCSGCEIKNNNYYGKLGCTALYILYPTFQDLDLMNDNSAFRLTMNSRSALYGKYLGCYKDSGGLTGVRGIPEYYVDIADLTIEKCSNECYIRGYTVVGLQYGTNCFCSHNHGPELHADNFCPSRCAGNTSQVCGGGWMNSVYFIRESYLPFSFSGLNLTNNFYTYGYGCFQNTGHTHLINSKLSPISCSYYCRINFNKVYSTVIITSTSNTCACYDNLATRYDYSECTLFKCNILSNFNCSGNAKSIIMRNSIYFAENSKLYRFTDIDSKFVKLIKIENGIGYDTFLKFCILSNDYFPENFNIIDLSQDSSRSFTVINSTTINNIKSEYFIVSKEHCSDDACYPEKFCNNNLHYALVGGTRHMAPNNFISSYFNPFITFNITNDPISCYSNVTIVKHTFDTNDISVCANNCYYQNTSKFAMNNLCSCLYEPTVYIRISDFCHKTCSNGIPGCDPGSFRVFNIDVVNVFKSFCISKLPFTGGFIVDGVIFRRSYITPYILTPAPNASSVECYKYCYNNNFLFSLFNSPPEYRKCFCSNALVASGYSSIASSSNEYGVYYYGVGDYYYAYSHYFPHDCLNNTETYNDYFQNSGYNTTFLSCLKPLQIPNNLQSFKYNSHEMCASYCFNKNKFIYSYINNKCYCDVIQGERVFDVNCTTNCNGENLQYCGGNTNVGIYDIRTTSLSAINLNYYDNNTYEFTIDLAYPTRLILSAKYIGCYMDPIINDYKSDLYSFNLGIITIENCLDFLYHSAYKNSTYLVFRSPNRCSGINTLTPQYNVTWCTHKCGPTSFPCGGEEAAGFYAISRKNIYITATFNETVYQKPDLELIDEIDSIEPNWTVNVHYVGCFDVKVYNNYFKFDYSTNEGCLQHCSYQWKLFGGTISTNECVCLDKLPENSTKVDDSLCTSTCSQSNYQTCGVRRTPNSYVHLYGIRKVRRSYVFNPIPSANYTTLCGYDLSLHRESFSIPYNSLSIISQYNLPSCSTSCNDRHYLFASMQNTECRCSNHGFIRNHFSDDGCNTCCSKSPKCTTNICGRLTTSLYTFRKLITYGPTLLTSEIPSLVNDLSINVSYIGCTKDKPQISSKIPILNAHLCSQFCSLNDYLISGIKSINSSCSCFTYQLINLIEDSNCNTNCSKTNYNPCGSDSSFSLSMNYLNKISNLLTNLTNESYITLIKNNINYTYTDIGCYLRYDYVFNSSYFVKLDYVNLNKADCVIKCANLTYEYASLTPTSCYCSNNISSLTDTYCTVSCADSGLCGSEDAMITVRVDKVILQFNHSQIVTPSWLDNNNLTIQPIGCFNYKNSTNSKIIKPISIEACSQYCITIPTFYSAISNTNSICICTNNLLNKLDDDSCLSDCEDKYCGNEDRYWTSILSKDNVHPNQSDMAYGSSQNSSDYRIPIYVPSNQTQRTQRFENSTLRREGLYVGCSFISHDYADTHPEPFILTPFSLQSCFSLCLHHEPAFSYAMAQFENKCLCSNNLTTQLDDKYCSSTCSNDSQSICGTDISASVFRVTEVYVSTTYTSGYNDSSTESQRESYSIYPTTGYGSLLFSTYSTQGITRNGTAGLGSSEWTIYLNSTSSQSTIYSNYSLNSITNSNNNYSTIYSNYSLDSVTSFYNNYSTTNFSTDLISFTSNSTTYISYNTTFDFLPNSSMTYNNTNYFITTPTVLFLINTTIITRSKRQVTTVPMCDINNPDLCEFKPIPPPSDHKPPLHSGAPKNYLNLVELSNNHSIWYKLLYSPINRVGWYLIVYDSNLVASCYDHIRNTSYDLLFISDMKVITSEGISTVCPVAYLHTYNSKILNIPKLILNGVTIQCKLVSKALYAVFNCFHNIPYPETITLIYYGHLINITKIDPANIGVLSMPGHQYDWSTCTSNSLNNTYPVSYVGDSRLSTEIVMYKYNDSRGLHYAIVFPDKDLSFATDNTTNPVTELVGYYSTGLYYPIVSKGPVSLDYNLDITYCVDPSQYDLKPTPDGRLAINNNITGSHFPVRIRRSIESQDQYSLFKTCLSPCIITPEAAADGSYSISVKVGNDGKEHVIKYVRSDCYHVISNSAIESLMCEYPTASKVGIGLAVVAALSITASLIVILSCLCKPILFCCRMQSLSRMGYAPIPPPGPIVGLSLLMLLLPGMSCELVLIKSGKDITGLISEELFQGNTFSGYYSDDARMSQVHAEIELSSCGYNLEIQYWFSDSDPGILPFELTCCKEPSDPCINGDNPNRGFYATLFSGVYPCTYSSWDKYICGCCEAPPNYGCAKVNETHLNDWHVKNYAIAIRLIESKPKVSVKVIMGTLNYSAEMSNDIGANILLPNGLITFEPIQVNCLPIGKYIIYNKELFRLDFPSVATSPAGVIGDIAGLDDAIPPKALYYARRVTPLKPQANSPPKYTIIESGFTSFRKSVEKNSYLPVGNMREHNCLLYLSYSKMNIDMRSMNCFGPNLKGKIQFSERSLLNYADFGINDVEFVFESPGCYACDYVFVINVTITATKSARAPIICEGLECAVSAIYYDIGITKMSFGASVMKNAGTYCVQISSFKKCNNYDAPPPRTYVTLDGKTINGTITMGSGTDFFGAFWNWLTSRSWFYPLLGTIVAVIGIIIILIILRFALPMILTSRIKNTDDSDEGEVLFRMDNGWNIACCKRVKKQTLSYRLPSIERLKMIKSTKIIKQ